MYLRNGGVIPGSKIQKGKGPLQGPFRGPFPFFFERAVILCICKGNTVLVFGCQIFGFGLRANGAKPLGLGYCTTQKALALTVNPSVPLREGQQVRG